MSLDATAARPLQGRVALVTGCGRRRGIGAGIAAALASAGAAIAITDIGPDKVAPPDGEGLDQVGTVLRSQGAEVLEVYADLTVPGDITSAVGQVLDRFGRVDVLVNNAAAPHATDRGDPVGVALADLDSLLDVNVRAAFLLMQAVVPSMRARQHGRIVNISSQAARFGVGGRAVYITTKAALLGMTRALAVDLGPSGITVNAVCPGAISTDRLADTMRKEGPSAGGDAGGSATDEWTRTIPVGRLGTPQDIGAAVAFLATDAAGYVNGHTLSVDGGRFPV